MTTTVPVALTEPWSASATEKAKSVVAALPVRVRLTVRSPVVLPVRETRKLPVAVPSSLAAASRATMLTNGSSSRIVAVAVRSAVDAGME